MLCLSATANVLVNQNCSVKLCDFGLARGGVDVFNDHHLEAEMLAPSESTPEQSAQEAEIAAQAQQQGRTVRRRELTKYANPTTSICIQHV